jgi:DNA-cytosine methyltransferase
VRVGSLFSGIGGLEYGLERSGLATSSEWMIEMDDFCCSILEKNFPNSLVINDKVENINPLDLPKIDILTAGFPCQPVSTAGSRKGVMDERWLWDEVWRFIDVLRPRYFILENVPGLFTANKGEAFERVIKDIAQSRSYRFEWQIISARSVGAAHLRKRFFGVGILGNTEHNGSSSSEKGRSIGERTVSWRQGEEVKEKINRESKGEYKNNSILNSKSKSSNETNKQTSSISESREARLNIGAGYGREQSRINRKEAELWMGSTAYGFSRWMARLGLVNVWSAKIDPFPTPASRDWKDTYGSNTDPNTIVAGVAAHKKTMPRNVFYRLKQQEEYPTPSSSEHKYRLQGNTQASKNLEARSRRGELNAEYDVWEKGMPRSSGDYPNRKNKLMALGNAVVPQCAELVGRMIKRADELGTMVFDTSIKEEE